MSLDSCFAAGEDRDGKAVGNDVVTRPTSDAQVRRLTCGLQVGSSLLKAVADLPRHGTAIVSKSMLHITGHYPLLFTEVITLSPSLCSGGNELCPGEA